MDDALLSTPSTHPVAEVVHDFGATATIYAPYVAIRNALRPEHLVLDVGCGNGKVAKYLATTGATIDGLEPDEARRQVAETRLHSVSDMALETFARRPESREKYDVVLLLDVVEHFADPHRALKCAVSLLREGGTLWALIPNSAHYTFRWKMLRGDWSYDDSGLFDRTHLRFFDVATSQDVVASTPGLRLMAAYHFAELGPLLKLRSRLAQMRPNLFAMHTLIQACRPGH